jgi:DNA-binding MarR family transcriptional regulator
MSKYQTPLNIRWFATTKLGIEELAKNTGFSLTASDFRLLFYLLSRIDENNRARVPKQSEISNEINISIRKISEGLGRLKKANIILNHKDDDSKTYFINPAFFYTGGASVIEPKQRDFNNQLNPTPATYTPTADAAEMEREYGITTTDSLKNPFTK